MQADFWHQLWEEGRLGFHQEDGNPKLRQYLPVLKLPEGARIFVPLCGKTRDIAWLLSQGFTVVGAELSVLAIDQLFKDLGVAPQVTDQGALQRYSAPGLDLYAGDIFDLTRDGLGQVDAVFDRAAIVALPPDLRRRYAAHMVQITDTAPQLMMTFEYDQAEMTGPPFSVPETEVRGLQGSDYHVELLDSGAVDGNLKGRIAAQDHVWHLTPHTV